MAKISLSKDGYLKLANPITRKLQSFRVPGQAFQCLWVILVKTWGFNKKQDDISLSQFVEATGLSSSNIIRGLDLLCEIKMIGRKRNIAASGRFLPTTYWIIKDVDLWIPIEKKKRGVVPILVVPNTVLPKKGIAQSQKREKGAPKKETYGVLSKKGDTTNITNNNTTNNIQQTGLEEEQIRLLQDLFNKVTGRIDAGTRHVSFFRPVIINQLIKINQMPENYTYEEIARVIVVMASWWLKDPKMKQHLTPETLFRPVNFPKYVTMEPKSLVFSENKKTDANLKASFSWLESQGIKYNEIASSGGGSTKEESKFLENNE